MKSGIFEIRISYPLNSSSSWQYQISSHRN